MKKGLRGFTLIELLVVIAIIGLLSTVIAGPVQTGLKKGRDAKKIGDLKQIQSALAQYSADNGGTYPTDLGVLVPSYMAFSQNMAATSSTRDRIMYVTFADTAGNLVSYHLGVPLENQNVVLQADADCMQAASPTAGNGLCSSTLATSGNINFSNYGSGSGPTGVATAGNAAAGAVTADFGGAGTAEAAGGTCTNLLSTCIYDVVPQ